MPEDREEGRHLLFWVDGRPVVGEWRIPSSSPYCDPEPGYWVESQELLEIEPEYWADINRPVTEA
jgi:hypothetical protein